MHFPLRRKISAVLRHRPCDVVHAVDGVDLAVSRGEIVGLVGESGSGKSTLARCVVGLYKPTAGQVLFHGKDLTAQRTRQERRRIQIVFQDPYASLNPRMTVRQVLRELLATHQIVPRAQIGRRSGELLGLVGLGPRFLDVYPRQLSGGQRQRVSIARALALEPEFLIADEPVSALDVSVQATILNVLIGLRDRLGLTILLVTHDMAVVRQVSDRIAVMYLGKLVEVTETEAMFSDPRHPYTCALLAAVPTLTPERKSEAAAVIGDPPSPVHPPSGCRFHPRCPLAAPLCSEQEPSLVPGPDLPSHLASCHFAWTAAPISRSAEEGHAMRSQLESDNGGSAHEVGDDRHR
jgi:oligopeptide/dipeptide ABC transporter ATP-binding protein